MRLLKFLYAPKTLDVLGFLGVTLAVWHLVQPNTNLRPGFLKSDSAYNFADEALAFAAGVTLLISARLDALDKRLKKLEEQPDRLKK